MFARVTTIRTLVTTALVLLFGASVWASGRGLHKQLYVVPVPRKVVVDGKLNDWDLSGQIRSYVIPETAEMQSARLAMMYDKSALYLSGVVRDTSPMMNRHDPKTDPQRAWDADVCQLFFSLDPDLLYPITASSFSANPRAPVATMYLWYYTDRQEPCLAMYRGMRFSEAVRPDLDATGVIPHAQYTAAFVKAEDGRGYTFEYRIPWATFGMARAPKAKDILAATVAVYWSSPDGLKTAGGAAWAYDIMSGPGFPFQSTTCWGKLLFTERGNVPRELVEAGLPPEKPLPLKFTYQVPRDSEVTVQLFDQQKNVVRILVPQQARRAGENVELWDGLDGQGNPLPAGTYTWKGVYHDPISVKFRFSAHNSGTPPYPTDDNRGGWGGDHGNPTTVCAVPGGMVLAWDVCEYGWGIIRLDTQDRKIWGSRYTATHLATDGQRLFIAGGAGFHSHAGVQVLDLKDARPLNFTGNASTMLPPKDESDPTYRTYEVTGLAYHAGRIYVAFKQHDLIAVYDAATAALQTTWQVPAPERIAVRPDGTLAVISGGAVVVVRDGQVSPWISTNLDEPVGVAVAADGAAYVANRGQTQNVAVFDAGGKYVRSIGMPGGRPAVGRYDRAGMYLPGGIGLDARGRLWVAETADGPKRVSVWNPQDGANVCEFFGASSYFGYGYIDPEKPDEIYAHHTLWGIDWKNYTTTPLTTIWRKTAPNMMEAPSPAGYGGEPRMITAHNGRQYMWGNAAHKTVLLRRDGDVFKPCTAIMHIGYGWSLYRGQGIPVMDNKEHYGNGDYFWQDANDDQCVQAEEVSKLPKALEANGIAWIEKDLTMRLKTGHILRPQRVTPGGQPLYDPAKAEATPLVGNKLARLPGAYFSPGQDGATYTYAATTGPALIKWSPDGVAQWSYPNIPRWHDALNLPIVGPGRLWGMTGPMGVTDRFLAYMTYFGVNHVFTTDGIYVAALLQDGRLGGRGADEGQPEGQGGQFVKLNIAGQERYFIIHGGQDSRVWEVMGLDTVAELPGGVYTLTEKDVALATDKLADYTASLQQRQQFTIVRGRQALELAQPVGKAVDSNRKFDVRAAYDAQNLYLRYDVTTSAPLNNAIPESPLIFRGGNLLDIQLATDKTADPNRKAPAPGDLRILITRQQGKPFAVLYRPCVAGFAGTAVPLTSPTGQESFDVIEKTERIAVTVKPMQGGFQAEVTIPCDLLGWQPQPGQQVRMDVGYIFGNTEGTRTAVRAYWKNNSFTANVTNDVPHESRLEPAEWGTAVFE